MEIFNLKANAWRAINDLKSSIPLNGLSISLNGFLHWLVCIGSYPNQKLGIVSFDLAEEKFMETVEVPDDFTQKYGANSLKIRRVGENLCVDTDYYGRYREG
ncbi:hypothetical protein M5689_007428 [Euphorbia peplus]|nr:hypothetical protein M5689_007428 [Euphorbia peplus]